MILPIISIILIISQLVIGYFIYKQQQQLHSFQEQQNQFIDHLENRDEQQQQIITEINASINKLLVEQAKLPPIIQIQLQNLMQQFQQATHQQWILLTKDMREQIISHLKESREQLTARMAELIKTTDDRLKHISGQVEQRLAAGFEKTNATFIDIVKRLTMIDEAQKRISELSSNVISLQDLLNDKRSRGALGEVQLSQLIQNTIPKQHYALQHTLSNGKRVDCILWLPDPTGHIAIDAKFPLENYQKLLNIATNDSAYASLQKLFCQDIKKHVDDIATKYIIPGETSDGAVMFIPAEAIFAKIHGDFPELVQYAHQRRVWLVSPTTMMAILTTARAVLKDSDTRKQVHIIQQLLRELSKDFSRFDERMQKLAKHINQAHADVELVNTSARKINQRFERIEQVELTPSDKASLLECD